MAYLSHVEERHSILSNQNMLSPREVDLSIKKHVNINGYNKFNRIIFKDKVQCGNNILYRPPP